MCSLCVFVATRWGDLMVQSGVVAIGKEMGCLCECVDGAGFVQVVREFASIGSIVIWLWTVVEVRSPIALETLRHETPFAYIDNRCLTRHRLQIPEQFVAPLTTNAINATSILNYVFHRPDNCTNWPENVVVSPPLRSIPLDYYLYLN